MDGVDPADPDVPDTRQWRLRQAALEWQQHNEERGFEGREDEALDWAPASESIAGEDEVSHREADDQPPA